MQINVLIYISAKIRFTQNVSDLLSSPLVFTAWIWEYKIVPVCTERDPKLFF